MTMPARICRLMLMLAMAMAPSVAISRKQRSQVRGEAASLTKHNDRTFARGIERREVTTERVLPSKGGTSGKGNRLSSYIGCLGLNSNSVNSQWKFHGKPKSCSYTHHAGKGKGNSGSGNGGGGGSGNGDGGGSGGGSGGGGSGGGGDNGGGGNGGGGNGNGGNGGNGGGNGNGNGGNGDGENNGGGGDNNGGGGDNNGDGGNNDGGGDDGRNSGNDDDSFDQDADLDESDFEDTDDFYDDDDDGQGGNEEQNNENDDGSGDEYDPYYDFDIETCDTYENLWIWDLSLTCESDEDLTDCECIFAEELLDLGLLQCSDATLCPSACPICATCMQLIGCTTVTTGISSERTSNTLYVVAAAIGLIVFGLVYFVARRRRHGSDLEAHLMEDEHIDTAPQPPPAPPEPTVWLAPEVPPAQFEPSARAATRSYKDSLEPMPILSPRPTFSPSSEDQVWLAPVT